MNDSAFALFICYGLGSFLLGLLAAVALFKTR